MVFRWFSYGFPMVFLWFPPHLCMFHASHPAPGGPSRVLRGGEPAQATAVTGAAAGAGLTCQARLASRTEGISSGKGLHHYGLNPPCDLLGKRWKTHIISYHFYGIFRCWYDLIPSGKRLHHYKMLPPQWCERWFIIPLTSSIYLAQVQTWNLSYNQLS